MKSIIKSKLYLLVAAVIIIAIGFYAYGIYTRGTIDVKGDELIIKSNQIEFENISTDFEKSNLSSFCIINKDYYRVGGIYLDFRNNNFVEMGPVDGQKITYEEALTKMKLTKEQFDVYKVFLDKYSFVKCIRPELNMKKYPEYMVLFEINDYKGFAYVSDGSISENIREDILANKFQPFRRIDDLNWYEFTYKNKFGI
ncbi:hypothetical protein JW977_01025 [Candidatus Falkowbacteria bacterium]|nr:hypothetical protein [Candidatus Falkowbacteria bacterium]